MSGRTLNREVGVNAAREAAKLLSCSYVMLGHGRFALIDDGDAEHIGRHLWHCSKFGYAVRFVGRKAVWMHREIFPTEMFVDHINLHRLDNRRSNLRPCDHRLNQGNRPKPKGGKSSRFKGVYFNKKDRRFQVTGVVGDKSANLGQFVNEIDAARRYNEWALGYFGEFARLNPV